MKRKPILIALAAFVIAAGSLAAVEPASEVLVVTALKPATAPKFLPLPEPGPVGFLIAETLPAPAFNLSIPMNVPLYRPALKSSKALFNANLVLMVGLNIADYISTREALKYPGLTETNPLMKPFVKSPAAFAAIKLGTTALSYWSMKVIFKRNKTVAWIMTTASNVLLSYVVANNMRLIHGARAR